MEDIEPVGKGWMTLVDTFRALVDWDTAHNNMPEVRITQIKEKFGSLRIYFQGGDYRTDAYASFADAASQRICEECGASAEPSEHKGWIRTVCNNCI